MAVSYNKMSSIQIGGTYVNYVSIGARGNVSLDCSGNSLFRGATFMDASLNVSGIFNVGDDVSMNSKLFVGGDVSMNSKLFVAGDLFMDGSLNVLNINSSNTISNFNFATNQTTGNINIGTGLTTGTISISNTATGNAPIIIGSAASTTQTLDINAITTFSKIPSTSVAPTTSNHLCNKTYVDNQVSGGSILGTANAFTNTNSFNSFLPTSTVTPSGSTDLTTKTYVDSAASTLLSSNNTWTGTNAFNTSLPTSTVTPTTSTQLTTKTYVDGVAGGSGLLSTNNTWTGTNAFNTSLPTSTLTPSSGTDLTTKTYVDSIGGVSLSSNNTWTGTNAFNTSLPTSTLTPSTSTQLTTKTYVDSNFCSLTGTQTVSGIKTFSGNNTYSGTSSFGSTVSINTTGGAATSIGNTSASIPTVELFGNVQINTGATNVRSTAIGNATGVTTVTGQFTCLDNVQLGSTSADFIAPNGTMTKPWVIGTYASQSSFSLSSITPVTTYLGGTIQTSASYGTVASGSFKYLMVSIAPYNASGGIALTAGTYMFWIGINFEDSSAYNLTDFRLGICTSSSLTSASSEATIIASLPNLTCYFHKTDAADAATSDSEQRVMSGCFNLASATTVYPFYGANHAAVTMDTITCDVVIVKIGGP